MKAFEKLEQFVKEKMAELYIPGVAVGILHGRERYMAGFGVTSVANPLEVTADTLFQIGSNTKTMTATIMMLLAQDGRLNFETPIRTYLPDFRVQDESVSATATVRDLLTHSAGWVGDHFINTGAGADASQRYVSSMAELPQIAPPATAFSYNNSAFVVAGLIIETITGLPYAQAAQEMLFRPLGMDNSFLEMADVMLRRFAVGHRLQDDHSNEVAGPWPLPRALYAAGAVTATVSDMLTYAQFYLDEGQTAAGEQLLPPQALQTLWTPQFKVHGDTEAVAYSWFVRQEDGRTTYSHGGATVEQYSTFKIVPAHDFALVLFTNSTNGRIFNREVEQFVLQEFCQLEQKQPPAINLSPAQQQALIGRYTRPLADFEWSLVEGELLGQVSFKQGFPTENDPPRPPTPLFRCTFFTPDSFVASDGPLRGTAGQIVRREDGSIGWVRFGMRLHQAPSTDV
ncbi:MAG: beta-lactamase family protein [Anaerolineales bacterium]|nr:beta-lactamase family protein [Anaerolineales bacterium]